MNKKAVDLYRGNLKDYPVETNTETDKLIKSIIEKTSQTAVNRADEVAVMQSMLNDKEFKVALFDRNKGFVGTRSPRNEAIGMSMDILAGTVGMSMSEALTLVENYEFTKRDATRFINMGKDFFATYLQTGRKTQIVSEPRGEAVVALKYVPAKEKTVPDRANPGKTKTIQTNDNVKLVASNKR